jgi:hypothetical protein
MKIRFLLCSVHRKLSMKISFIPQLACATGPPSSGLGHTTPLGHLPRWAAPRHCALRAWASHAARLPRTITPATLRAPRCLTCSRQSRALLPHALAPAARWCRPWGPARRPCSATGMHMNKKNKNFLCQCFITWSHNSTLLICRVGFQHHTHEEEHGKI